MNAARHQITPRGPPNLNASSRSFYGSVNTLRRAETYSRGEEVVKISTGIGALTLSVDPRRLRHVISALYKIISQDDLLNLATRRKRQFVHRDEILWQLELHHALTF